MTTIAHISLNIDGRLKIETPYSQGFIDDLKFAIPWQEREWVRPLKAWLVSAKYLKEVESLCTSHFDQVDINTQSSSSSSTDEIKELYGTLYLTPNAPKWLVKKVYRLLAQHFHPDVNSGGAEKMVVINKAWERLESL